MVILVNCYVEGAPSVRILLRSMLDTLNAQILCMKTQSGNEEYISDLEKIRGVVIKLQVAEAAGTPVDEEDAMSGLITKTDYELDPYSNYEGAELCGLNLLRAIIREAELSALLVFGVNDGLKICSTLKQLGSAVCALMRKYA